MLMKLIIYSVILIIAFLGYKNLSMARTKLNIGNAVPNFDLPDIHGTRHSLTTYQGQWLVLYFYPKDDTPGCTKEACQFRDDLQQLEALGAHVVGVSVDDRQSHAEFAKKYQLPFPLLSDKEGKVAASYGALTHLGLIKIAKRYTFLINPQGMLQKAYYNVDTSRHSQQIIDDLHQLPGVHLKTS
ncbi:MAG: peroxiredoxin [Methylophilaceae bacterium]